MTINKIEDLAEYVGVEVDQLKRALYKGTACGAWIEWRPGFVEIGSIVEGSEAEFSRRFRYPFESEEFDIWIEELEELTSEAWYEANGDWEEKDEY